MKRNHLLILLLFFFSFQSVFSRNNELSSVENTDYVQIILYGQSLGMGWECPRALSTTATEGNYMVGDNVLMKYNNDAKVLNPLVATKWANGGEQPIVSCVNVFSKMYRNSVNPNQKFIAMTGGEGGQTIERLSKECTVPNNYYGSTFIKILDNTITAINGKTVSCPAIIYMQGEYNCNNSSWYGGRGMISGSNGTTDKNVYKALLLQLKNNMQADIMLKYHQTQKPLFFIYQTSGAYPKMKELNICMAQLEFAEENEDVILLNPHYALPDYGGGHLSTNGYRWFGELTANTLSDVLIKNKSFKPVTPEKFTIQDHTIKIDYYVPVPPLVLDTWTNTKATNYGFAVYKDNVAVTIRNVEIVGGSSVVITSLEELKGKIEVVYAGNTTSGTGNLRDSDPKLSNFTYFDDTADSKKEVYTPKNVSGTKIYNQPYPLQNWSVGFYKKMDVVVKEPLDTSNITISHDTIDHFSKEVNTLLGEVDPGLVKFIKVTGAANMSYADCRALTTSFPNLIGLDMSKTKFLNDSISDAFNGMGAFENCTATSMILPTTIHVVGSSAFRNCPNLSALCLYGSVVHENAFDNCPNMKALYYTVDALPANTASNAFKNGIKVFLPYGKLANFNALANATIQDGTVGHEYQIASADDLDAARLFSTQFNTSFRMMNDIDLSAWIDNQANNDIRTNGWLPVGTASLPFSGNFDGQGHFVRNIWIKRASTNYIGLFGSLKGNATTAATVKNLGVVVKDKKSILGYQEVGGITGRTNDNAWIGQCCVTGDIIGDKSVAGIIGANYAQTTITQCYANGSVTAYGDGAGGLVGLHYSATMTLTVDMCYATNTVYASTAIGSGAGLVASVSHSSTVTPTITLLEVKNSFAINPSLAAQTAGRLVGWERTPTASVYTNNYAYAGMTLNGIATTNSDANLKSAADKSASELINHNTYSIWDLNNVWSMGNEAYQLPVLKNLSLTNQPIVALSYLGTPSGLNDTEIKKLFEVYPNPTSGILLLKNIPVGTNVSLFDCMGRRLMDTTESKMDISNLSAGLYFVKSGSSAIRIIKK